MRQRHSATSGAISLVLALAVVTVPLKAQFVVYDPTNYIEAVLQYEQILRQYEFLIQQARRVPVALATRYHAHSIDWTYHDLTAGLLRSRCWLARGATYASAWMRPVLRKLVEVP